MSTLMILGMHRSFTSLTARWLFECGLDVGHSLLPGSAGNEDGHFEDVEFLSLHKDILADNQLPVDGLRFPYDRTFDFEAFGKMEIRNEFWERAESILSARPSQFGWKEPRTCLFLPMYRELLPDAKSLIVVRHFDEVVRSLIVRDKDLVRQRGVHRTLSATLRGRFNSFDAFLGAWIFYNRCLLDHAERGQSKVIFDIVEQSEDVLRVLAGWGFELEHVDVRGILRDTIRTNLDVRSFPYDKGLLVDARAVLTELADFAESGLKD